MNYEQLEGDGAAAQAEAEHQNWLAEEQARNSRMDIIGQNGNEGTHYDRLQVLYFSAPWCGPCKMFGPAFDEIVAEFDDIDVQKINVDENTEAAIKYEVTSIPTVIMEKAGVSLFRHKGVMPKTHLRDLIKTHK